MCVDKYINMGIACSEFFFSDKDVGLESLETPSLGL